MPSLRASRVQLDPARWQKMMPQASQTAPPPVPVMPANLRRNARMLSSLPPIATNISTGGNTQFYGNNVRPRRQVILSS